MKRDCSRLIVNVICGEYKSLNTFVGKHGSEFHSIQNIGKGFLFSSATLSEQCARSILITVYIFISYFLQDLISPSTCNFIPRSLFPLLTICPLLCPISSPQSHFSAPPVSSDPFLPSPSSVPFLLRTPPPLPSAISPLLRVISPFCFYLYSCFC